MFGHKFMEGMRMLHRGRSMRTQKAVVIAVLALSVVTACEAAGGRGSSYSRTAVTRIAHVPADVVNKSGEVQPERLSEVSRWSTHEQQKVVELLKNAKFQRLREHFKMRADWLGTFHEEYEQRANRDGAAAVSAISHKLDPLRELDAFPTFQAILVDLATPKRKFPMVSNVVLERLLYLSSRHDDGTIPLHKAYIAVEKTLQSAPKAFVRRIAEPEDLGKRWGWYSDYAQRDSPRFAIDWLDIRNAVVNSLFDDITSVEYSEYSRFINETLRRSPQPSLISQIEADFFRDLEYPIRRAAPATEWPLQLPNYRSPAAQQISFGIASANGSNVTLEIARESENYKRTATLPAWTFFGVEAYWARRKISSLLDPELDMPLLFTSLPDQWSGSFMFPGKVTAQAYTATKTLESAVNFNRLLARKTYAGNVKFFNLLGAPPSDLEPSSIIEWMEIANNFSLAAGRLGLRRAKASKENLLETLAGANQDILIVLAHGDTESLYFSDGSKLTIDDIERLHPINVASPPLIVLLACHAGRPGQTSANSIAQALLAKGRASAVLAPKDTVSAESETVDLMMNLVVASSMGDMTGFLRRLKSPWQLYVDKANPEFENKIAGSALHKLLVRSPFMSH